ncbi:MAG: hypothetical protein NTV62_03810, partial [Candidatus Gribaldobacteria bacterium]|nr:hypothetical protein [Candidatus Gribaldobacteria bacterium]
MRVILQKDEQIKFIRDILSKISVSEAASLCGLSERTIRDWRRGKFTLDLVVTEILCKKTGILFPKIAELKDDYWYVALGSSLGAKTVLQKYGHVGGDPEYRKQKWFEWWEREGKIKNLNTGILARKPFKKPIFSEDLAEFVGILLGDGCISKNQINIAFNSEDENGYLPFVGNLVSKLFDVPFGIYKKIECNAVCLNISRTQLIEFLVQEVGLKRGNKVKQQVGVPAWIQNSREYLIACVRGLFDTDG